VKSCGWPAEGLRAGLGSPGGGGNWGAGPANRGGPRLARRERRSPQQGGGARAVFLPLPKTAGGRQKKRGACWPWKRGQWGAGPPPPSRGAPASKITARGPRESSPAESPPRNDSSAIGPLPAGAAIVREPDVRKKPPAGMLSAAAPTPPGPRGRGVEGSGLGAGARGRDERAAGHDRANSQAAAPVGRRKAWKGSLSGAGPPGTLPKGPAIQFIYPQTAHGLPQAGGFTGGRGASHGGGGLNGRGGLHGGPGFAFKEAKTAGGAFSWGRGRMRGKTCPPCVGRNSGGCCAPALGGIALGSRTKAAVRHKGVPDLGPKPEGPRGGGDTADAGGRAGKAASRGRKLGKAEPELLEPFSGERRPGREHRVGGAGGVRATVPKRPVRGRPGRDSSTVRRRAGPGKDGRAGRLSGDSSVWSPFWGKSAAQRARRTWIGRCKNGAVSRRDTGFECAGRRGQDQKRLLGPGRAERPERRPSRGIEVGLGFQSRWGCETAGPSE